MQTLKLSKYYEIISPQYICLKIIPFASNRNYNSSEIAKVFTKMYKKLFDRIKKDNNKFIIQGKMKSCYMIDISKENIGFYFIIPNTYKIMLIEAINRVWKHSSVTQIEIPKLKFSLIYQLKYKNFDSFSLDVNRKNNSPANDILNTIDLMSENERITIIYNFIPCSNYGWEVKCEKDMIKFSNNESITKDKMNARAIFTAFSKVIFFINEVIEKLINDKQVNENINPFYELTNILKENNRKLSEHSRKKRFDIPIDVQMLVCGNNESLDNTIKCICNSYQSISGDNELIYEKIHVKNINLTDNKFKGVDTNVCSIAECQNFIQLPDKEILEKNKAIIEYKDVQETSTPKELQHGIMCLGKNIKDNQNVYLSTDKSLQYLTLCLIAPTRSGKTTLIENLCKDAVTQNQCNIIFDWCGKCETTENIKKLFPDKTTVIDCSDFNNLQGLGYNELYCTSKNPFERYRSAKQQSSQLITLINSTMGGDEDLRSRMERYLGSSATIVFINNGSAKDVFMCLQDYKIRHKYIDMLTNDLYEFMDEQVNYLLELDKDGEKTNLNAIQGILNRLSRLKENAYLEMMLKKDCKNNFNLVDMIQKNQNICIKMHEMMFSTEQEKDTYAIYWLGKLWLSLQYRLWNINEKDIVKVNIYLDELYQCPNTQEFLRSKLSQIAKFKAKPIISCHYLQQIKIIRNELKSANASYVLISGSDKDNYKELETELNPYTVDDLLNLKRYHALSLIKYEGGYWKGVSKLPPPIVSK